MAPRKPAENVEEKVAEVLDLPSQELVEARSIATATRISDEELRDVTSFEDALALASDIYGDLVDVTAELGNGFTLITDKAPLVNVPFVILSCAFNEGDYGTFVSIAAVTKAGGKYIFNDGSTGVHNQLFELARTKKRTGGFIAPSGLSESTYPTCGNKDCQRARPIGVKQCPHCDDTGEKRGSATTYFLNLAPGSDD